MKVKKFAYAMKKNDLASLPNHNLISPSNNHKGKVEEMSLEGEKPRHGTWKTRMRKSIKL